MYENIANCINPIDTENRHITIHKAKGSEYNNVMIIQEKPKIIEFLLNPDLNKEEHRITYVAISRAKNRLFIHFNELSKDEENKIRKKYEYIDIIRLWMWKIRCKFIIRQEEMQKHLFLFFRKEIIRMVSIRSPTKFNSLELGDRNSITFLF